MTLKLFKPPNTQFNHDIFKSADYWLSKGYIMQSQLMGESQKVTPLSYYLAGVKIDPKHFGCVYNSGCCFFLDGKYKNAKKWFDLSLKLKPTC